MTHNEIDKGSSAPMTGGPKQSFKRKLKTKLNHTLEITIYTAGQSPADGGATTNHDDVGCKITPNLLEHSLNVDFDRDHMQQLQPTAFCRRLGPWPWTILYLGYVRSQ